MELKNQYEMHGILNATTVHKYKGGMAKYIEKNHGSISAFCDANGLSYLFRSNKNNWTEEKAKIGLQSIYQEVGLFSTSELMARNSGLEKYLRTKAGGVREFCEKNGLSHILKKPKVHNWTAEKALDIVKTIHKEYKKPVGINLLTKSGYGGLYQWATKQYGSYKEFIIQHELIEYTSYQNNWTDALCFRLIKDQFILNGGVFNPEIIKSKYKGAHAYIYNKHGSFENFLNTYDLQDYVEINNTIYTDEIVQTKIKEAFTLFGEKVYSSWLHENGFSGTAIYLTKIGEGSFINGAIKLGLTDFVISRHTDWTEELVLEKINEMLEKKGEALIKADFVNYKLSGMRDWIIKNYGGIKEFFEKHNRANDFVNMKHIGMELWAFGLQFEELAKEAIELIFEHVSYNKWIDNVRPDFIINEDLWIDSKLSSFAYFTDDTVKKYTARHECKELWLLYLRGHKFNHGREDVKLIDIKDWYVDLIKLGRRDLVEKFDDLREKVYEKERIDGKRIHI
ncbi:hypothetical protein Q8G35_23005 [Peribacillus simplex]|uniref:Uncharacterized protein n=2 Tax=Peribacillus TaxID=2675229 RepID=A0AA90PNJ1_9BACI|nr:MULTISPECIES: hypothetical protein [Peribacillus]MDP1421168.1 hypothetical protein [Peribacillus simplex]MDP1453935.1 hypothetical protein [Peribacillus frigoritolerans]